MPTPQIEDLILVPLSARTTPGLPRRFDQLMDHPDRNSTSGPSQVESSVDASVHNTSRELQATSEKHASTKRRTNWSLTRAMREKIWSLILKQGANQKGGSTQTGTQHVGDIPGSSSGKSEILLWSSPAADLEKIHGLEEEVEILEKSLLIPEVQFKAIGIVGIAGIGKTTLCQKLFNSEQVRSHFAPLIWVCVSMRPSEDPDIRVAILKRLLLELGVEEEVIDEDLSSHQLGGLLSLLHQHLWGKRYLIVLDDVRESEEWYCNMETCLGHGNEWKEKLAYGLPKGHGGTVIITSRSEEVAKKMVGPENLHQKMPIRNEQDCWLIFSDTAGAAHGYSDQEKLKKEIMEKSNGVPLAVKLMGEIVKKHLEEPLQNGDANPQ